MRSFISGRLRSAWTPPLRHGSHHTFTTYMSALQNARAFRRKRPFLAVAILASLVVCCHLWLSTWGSHAGWLETGPRGVSSPAMQQQLACMNFPGANETLVVLKTGASELDARLPVQLSTALRCYRHRLLFSDAAENFHGQPIIDALESVSQVVKEAHPDFAWYRRLRDHGRAKLASDELYGPTDSSATESSVGHPENPGWKLDKWKFLPIVNRTFHEYPDMKWYVFTEADTYILWPSLLEYLDTLDPSQPYYAGVRAFISGVAFAHGGSGFIVSQPAMRLVVDHFNARQEEIEDFTSSHWAGDCVLGKAFADAGVTLTDAWPIIQGDHPGLIAYIAPDGRPTPISNERIWCNPTVSYHHMQPAMVEDFWAFEQQWLGQRKEGQTRSLRHSDVFRQYIIPRIQTPRQDWDNESGKEVGKADSFDVCRSWCESSADCVQFALHGDGLCRHFHLPRLGMAAQGVQSGWLEDRIERLVAAIEPCDYET